ncbi:uncharacterized protein LOC142564508 [Dermacentor variabilis]|uniref:uncharacterized protein LOC142564508 n=1 Tax=Dermacentor variabilis TaxID=34621 RepID=UPI003F5BADB6
MMKVLAITCFGILASLHLAAADDVQRPKVTRCNGTDFSNVRISDVTLTNARLGHTVQLDGQLIVYNTTGTSPVLDLSVTSSSGKPLTCIYSVFPKEMKLCDADTNAEKQLGAAWNSSCPLKPGVYRFSLSFYVPDAMTTRSCIGDGHVVETLTLKDEGYILDCVSYPVTFDLY